MIMLKDDIQNSERPTQTPTLLTLTWRIIRTPHDKPQYV